MGSIQSKKKPVKFIEVNPNAGTPLDFKTVEDGKKAIAELLTRILSQYKRIEAFRELNRIKWRHFHKRLANLENVRSIAARNKLKDKRREKTSSQNSRDVAVDSSQSIEDRKSSFSSYSLSGKSAAEPKRTSELLSFTDNKTTTTTFDDTRDTSDRPQPASLMNSVTGHGGSDFDEETTTESEALKTFSQKSIVKKV